MFEVNHIKNQTSNCVEIKDTNQKAHAKIDLNLGGSLQDLVLDGNIVISSRDTVAYGVSYASSILFPFANRVENGSYSFNGKNYQLYINNVEENNAIHGLVYDKEFELVHLEGYESKAMACVRCVEDGEHLGFPFKYQLTLTYIIKASSAELIVEVKNCDDCSFPYTIGWHPYFVSSNLSGSSLNLNCSKKILVNSRQIPTHEIDFDSMNGIKINDMELDDCFVLNDNRLSLKTPKYQMDFCFSTDTNYIHLYIPSNRKAIAIEPQTGAANNFNNHRGLKILHPKETFQTHWKIDVKATTV